MITLPSVLIYKDIEVFPDHEDCNKYYCIRSVPHVGITIFRYSMLSTGRQQRLPTKLPYQALRVVA